MTTNFNKLILASVMMMTITAAPAFAQDATGTTTSGTSNPGYGVDNNGPLQGNDKPTSVKGEPLGAQEETQRDTNQQGRVENGLKDGQLSTGEAARLEKGESRIDATEARDMKDGSLSQKEKDQIQREQNQESRRIYKDRRNNINGNANSASDKRMQGVVQRDANQEQRIHNGVSNGSMTNKEASRAERGQARTDRAEYRAGRNGHMGKRGFRNVEHRENRQSGRIHREKHNRGHRHKR